MKKQVILVLVFLFFLPTVSGNHEPAHQEFELEEGYYYEINIDKIPISKFLKDYFERTKYTSILTNDFKTALSLYFNKDLDELFNRFIYGQYTKSSDIFHEVEENPYHPKRTESDLMALL